MKYLLAGEETNRLLFREIHPDDYASWLPFFKDPRAHQHWVPAVDDPTAACNQWYEKQNQRYQNDLGGMNALIEKGTGKLVGHSGLLVQEVDEQTELEIAYSLLPEFWNRGFALEAAQKCREFAFTHDFAPSLISIISISNTPSARVAVRNGMQIDKTTLYKGNRVNIFRITRAAWTPAGNSIDRRNA